MPAGAIWNDAGRSRWLALLGREGWWQQHLSQGRRVGKDSPSAQQMEKKEKQGCRGTVVDWWGCSLMLWPGGLEESPGHPLPSITLEVGCVLPANHCRVSLIRDGHTQDIRKSINLISPGNCPEGWVTWPLILLGLGTLYFHLSGESLALCKRVAGDILQSDSHFIPTFLAVMTPRGMCVNYNCVCRLNGLWWWAKARGKSTWSSEATAQLAYFRLICWQEFSRRDRFQYALSAASLHAVDDVTLRPSNNLLPKCEVWGGQMIIWTYPIAPAGNKSSYSSACQLSQKITVSQHLQRNL